MLELLLPAPQLRHSPAILTSNLDSQELRDKVTALILEEC